MQPFCCGHCGHTVFFDNDRCFQCGSALGYLPGHQRMVALQPGDAPTSGPTSAPTATPMATPTAVPLATPTAAPPDDAATRWWGQGTDEGRTFTACRNRDLHAVCNWLLDEGDPQPLCRSCRLTACIPDLSDPANLPRWRAIERAKRRVVYSLIGLGLAPEPKQGPDDPWGLSFQLLASGAGAPPVMTGHDSGVITLNIAEADDLHREQTRLAMGEPVRTLLGHVRHEVSHYLQYRHLQQGPQADDCRAAFGDERSDYAQALAAYHASGPAADWQQRFISAYASAHPWEDWAETCAHYLLITDAVETASRWGLQLQGPSACADLQAALQPAEPQVAQLVLEQWLPVARFVNAMNRSLGMPDSYPYLMPDPVVQKMATVGRLLHQAGRSA